MARLWKQHRNLIFLYGLLFAMILTTASVFPAFRSMTNLSNVLSRAVPLALVALGQTFVILSGNGGIDLSVGSVVSLSTAIVVNVMAESLPSMALAVFLVMVAGVAVGLINGMSVTVFKMNPLIATLITMIVVQGVALFLLPHPGGVVPYAFIMYAAYEIGRFNIIPLYLLIAGLLCYYILYHTVAGRHLFAVGGGERQARYSGIAVNRSKTFAYVLSGLLSALGGLLMAVRLYSGDPNVGAPFILDSISAVLLGGTTFEGGRGSIGGTIAAVLILIVLQTTLNFFQVHGYYQYIVRGIILIGAILLYNMRRTVSQVQTATS